jgi:class 3 adenylate cyclase
MIERAASAREAMRRHAWLDAVEAFSEVDRAGGLGPEDLELLAAALWWSGDVDGAVEVLERAHTGHLEAEQPEQAAIVALRLGELAMLQLSAAIAGGWIARAERLLEHRPEGVAHAWLSFANGLVALLGRGDFAAAEALATRSLELARTHRSPDIESLALSLAAQVLLRTGRWSEGLTMIDEAAAAATSDRLDPKNACDVYCFTISACADVGAYRRAGEWIEKADAWMRRRSITGYRGVCKVHRAELKRLRGDWHEAEREAREACVELERFRLLDAVGFARYEVGEVRLRMGDFAAAAEAFQKAYEYGRLPQPGLALLMLARGETSDAVRSIASSLSVDDGDSSLLARDQLTRARLLAAQAEIALAAGDLATARAAVAELASIAARYESDALTAAALTAQGALELHEEAPEAAIATLRRAWRLWLNLELPFEGARARVLLGRARLAAGDAGTARLELRAARTVFERLGATPDLQAVHALLGEESGAESRASVAKTFMFTDIVGSTDFLRLIGDADWKRLIEWHDKALRSLIEEHGGHEVRHTGDGFFVTFDRPTDAVACAIAVQRALSEHRRHHGFAPRVRIGLHAGEAVEHGRDYAGQGVHVAARVGAIATAEEIVVTESLLDAARSSGYGVTGPRAEALKGFAEPVEVWSVDWERSS